MTTTLAPAPVFQGTGPNGIVPGGLLWTYIAGTATPQASYVDSTQTQQNTNPVILNSNGQANVWLVFGQVYKLVLQDSSGNQIWSVDQVPGGVSQAQLLSILTQSVLGSILFPLTTAEIANNITPSNYGYPAGDVRRYGGDPTGFSDSTIAINNALKCNGRVYLVSGTYTCSASLNMISGQTLYGDGPASVLQFANGALSNVVMQSITGATVRDLKINVTGTNGTTKLGAVYISQSTLCHVERVEAAGYNWAGVWLDQANQCFIRNNYLHSCPVLLNTTGNGGDINLWSNSATQASNYNVIDGNQCFGINTAFGIMLIDPDAATAITGYPLRNVVNNNRIGTHTSYGIALYMPGAATTAADTFNQITNNWVENITGLSFTGFPGSPNTSSGAGIYAVGKGIGGTVIANNTVSNCCTQTLVRNLAPAGIGVNGVQTGVTRPVVANNTVDGMTQGDGILLTSAPGGAVITGNSVNMPSSNTGAGPGGASLKGMGIRVEAASNFTVGPNNVECLGTGAALFVYANGIASNNGSIAGGVYVQSFAPGSAIASDPCVFITQNGGFNPQNIALSGVRAIASNAQSANDAFSINSGTNITLTGCNGNAAIGRGLLVNTSTIVRVTGGALTTSSGTAAVTTSGPCTSGFLDESVYTGASATLINNAGTGFTIKMRLSAVPAAGTWAIGDTVFNSQPSAAGVFLWVTTTAGAGTWKTVSNT